MPRCSNNRGVCLGRRRDQRLTGDLQVGTNSVVAIYDNANRSCNYVVSRVNGRNIILSIYCHGTDRDRPSVGISLCRNIPGNSGVRSVVRGYIRLNVRSVAPVLAGHDIDHPRRGRTRGGEVECSGVSLRTTRRDNENVIPRVGGVVSLGRTITTYSTSYGVIFCRNNNRPVSGVVAPNVGDTTVFVNPRNNFRRRRIGRVATYNTVYTALNGEVLHARATPITTLSTVVLLANGLR